MQRDHLFVYGTLGREAGHPLGDLLRAKADWVGAGSIRARLYLIDDPDEPGRNFYPGALPAPDPADRVYGEVYRVRDAAGLFPALDRFEACSPDHPEPHEFMLRPTPVRMEDGETLWAVTYFYTWDVADAARIPSGRFEGAAADVR